MTESQLHEYASNRALRLLDSVQYDFRTARRQLLHRISYHEKALDLERRTLTNVETYGLASTGPTSTAHRTDGDGPDESTPLA